MFNFDNVLFFESQEMLVHFQKSTNSKKWNKVCLVYSSVE